jgi:signal peptidase II
MRRSNSGLFWPVLVLVTTIDFCTKALAVSRLIPQRLPHDVFGGWLRFTLVYNPGAAFGLNVGQYSRWIFMALTFIALVILGWLYAATRPGDVLRTVSLALVCGGALGNLIDRVRWSDGVVDFVDIGFGDARWPTFNLADMAVSIGAFMLAWVLWGEDAEPEAALAAPGAAPALAGVGETTELH